jgi:hypothetical protein
LTRAGGYRGTTTGIAVAPDGRSYVVGWFDTFATFGAGEPGETTFDTVAVQAFLASLAP